MKTFIKNILPVKGKFLVITAIIELLIGIPVMIFIVILGYQGFVAGEMGTMIGLFSIASLVFLLPYVVLKGLMIKGLSKKKKWPVFLAFLFAGIYFVVGILSISDLAAISIFLFMYSGFTLWSGVKYLQNYNEEV